MKYEIWNNEVWNKENNEHYERNSLHAMMASFERYLKKKNYSYSILRDVELKKHERH